MPKNWSGREVIRFEGTTAKEERVMFISQKTPSQLALAAFAAMVSATIFALPARAHDAIPTAAKPLGWAYPWACCANQDCQQVSAKAISERPNGYVVAATGEVIPYQDKRIKDSPDGEYHWCAHPSGVDAGHTICLFVPPKGF
jgi:hypothetical protein